jgi:hypothetical protein
VKLNTIHTFRHPVDDVFAALVDAEAVTAKYEAAGQSDVRVVRREDGDDGAVTLVTARVVPLELPGFAKKVLSPRQSVTQTDIWSAPDGDGRRTGTFTVEAKGTPVQVRGTLDLAPDGATACTNTIDVVVECKVPLIGGKIADLVAGDTRRALEHEQSWTNEHLES